MNLLNILPQPWAIMPDRLAQIVDIVTAHLRGPKLNLKAMEEKILAGDIQPVGHQGVMNTVAVIPIAGPIMKSPDIFDRVLFGAVSSSRIKAEFLALVNDPSVSKIIFYIDSPGGTVDGTQELAQAIYENRGEKEVLAFTDGLMASAAYWIGSAADKIFISSDTVNVGSIGVIATHIDYSEQDRMNGVSVSEIVAGKYKNLSSPNAPLSDDGRAWIQDHVDYLYSVFVGDVARNRGVDVETVLSRMADAQIFVGQQAIGAGLVDGVSTLDALIDGTYSNQSISVGAGAVTTSDKSNKQEGMMELTIQSLEKDFPEIYKAVFEAGRSAGMADVEAEKEKAKAEGQAAEIARIKSVKEMAVSGHEALVEKLMFDGSTTGEQAAVQILKAEQSVKKEALDALASGAPAPVEQPAAPEPAQGSDADNDLPVEERAKAEWSKSKELRAEFGDDYDAYLAFKKNDEAGRIRIKNGGKK